MNQTMNIRGKIYEISGVDETQTKFILKSSDGQPSALAVDAALLDVFTKQAMAVMPTVSTLDELTATMAQPDVFLAANGAYQRMKELLPNIALNSGLLEKRKMEIVEVFKKQYPNKVVAVATPSVPTQEVAPTVAPGQDVVTSENQSVVEVASPATPEVTFMPLNEINVMLIEHDQKLIRQFLLGKYTGYEVNEDFTLARDPRTNITYKLSINDTGEVEMVSTARDMKAELANTPALSETQILDLENKSINELRAIRTTSNNLAVVNKINEIIEARKAEVANLDETQLIDQHFLNKQLTKTTNMNTMGFVSHLTISFLVGILGGVALMVVGNAISLLM